MKKFTPLLFIIFNFLLVCAQTSKIDSLENLLQKHTKKDTVRINLLNNYANSINNTKSIKYAEEALELSELLNFKKGEANSLKYIGILYEKQGDFHLSLENYEKAIKVNEEIDNKQEIAVCLKYIGIVNEKLGNYSLSIETLQKALKINEEIRYNQGIANCLHNIGVVYHRHANYPMSLEYYQKALKIYEAENSKKHIGNCLNNIGAIYFEQTNYILANSYYQKLLNISKEIAYKEGEARALNNIGEVYRRQNNLELALIHFQESLKIIEKIGDENEIAMTTNNIGRIYYQQANYALALNFFQKALKMSEKVNNKLIILDSYANLGSYYSETSDYNKALDYTKKSFLIATEIKSLSQKKRIYLQFSEIYTAKKNFKKALENYILYKELNDSIFNQNNNKEIARLEYQSEFEKEKQAIELEQQKKDAITAEKLKRHKILNIAFILVFFLMTSLVLVILRSFFQKRKANNILTKQKLQIEATNKELTLQKEEIQNVAFELEKANKTKDKFFSIIAHDLKNPFNVLLGFSDILLENNKTIDEEKRKTYIKVINESLKKTYSLLENLLTWAQSQTGKIKFKKEIINVSELITETISLLEETALNKKIKLAVNDETDLLINADKNMIETVIRNLVSNAIKFTPKGGDIIVKSQTITDENNQKFAEISVKDSGVGIPHQTQSKLFEITENISTKGTEKETGTGLGLILCKEFVEKHNGKIWVESNVDKGSKFVFRIPLSS